tara:strand:- start:97 stop:939 length:843 start_codon:yes stop_codon:yes gene_type:complete
MGKVGGGVDISHKSKMSGKAKSLMSFPGGMPGPGDYGSTNNVVGRGMARYIAGGSVGIGMKMGKTHGGPEKGKAHKNTPYKLGDLSVEAGIDNNPEVTRADIITGAKKNKSGGVNKSGGPAKPEKKLPTYDQAYDAQSDEKKKTQSREQFKKEAKAYNQKKYGTTEPSKDSSEAGLKRKDLAENQKTKKETTSFDGSGSNKKKGEDKKEGKKRVVAKDADASTRKGRKAMKDADKKSGDSRKEVKSRKLQRKAGAAEGDKKARLEARVKRRKERLAKKKK